MNFQSEKVTQIFSVLDSLIGKDLSNKNEFFLIANIYSQQIKQREENKRSLGDIQSAYLRNRNQLIDIIGRGRSEGKEHFINTYLPESVRDAQKIDAEGFNEYLNRCLDECKAKYRSDTKEYYDAVVKSMQLIDRINVLTASINSSISKAGDVKDNKWEMDTCKRALNTALSRDFKLEDVDKYKKEVEKQFASVNEYFTEEVFDYLWLLIKDFYENITSFCVEYQRYQYISSTPYGASEIQENCKRRLLKSLKATTEIKSKLEEMTDQEIYEMNQQVFADASSD